MDNLILSIYRIHLDPLIEFIYKSINKEDRFNCKIQYE